MVEICDASSFYAVTAHNAYAHNISLHIKIRTKFLPLTP